MKTLRRVLQIGGLTLLAAGLASAPIQFSASGLEIAKAHAVHLTPDANHPNNGHGDNINPATGEKVDDFSNPNWAKDSRLDANSGLGDDKNGNNGKGAGK